MPKSSNWGGKRQNAGRKPKAQNKKLKERLNPLDDAVFKSLQSAIRNGESWAIKLYFEYQYGKPIQRTEGFNEVTILDLSEGGESVEDLAKQIIDYADE